LNGREKLNACVTNASFFFLWRESKVSLSAHASAAAIVMSQSECGGRGGGGCYKLGSSRTPRGHECEVETMSTRLGREQSIPVMQRRAAIMVLPRRRREVERQKMAHGAAPHSVLRD